jgi:hypothetical protein
MLKHSTCSYFCCVMAFVRRRRVVRELAKDVVQFLVNHETVLLSKQVLDLRVSVGVKLLLCGENFHLLCNICKQRMLLL